jgi:TrpR-related protein YerC/YecD
MARARQTQATDAAPEPEHELEWLPGLDDLAAAFLALRTDDNVKRFLRDLCTYSELEALTHRWQIARLLDGKKSYVEIAEEVHASTATVTRVAHWLHHGAGGYAVALDRTRKPA